ncbi:tRNA preQ1(34) S-adenosylmethionine ribosyltransferase-isomerase QueA [Candidatus Aciduliprofundum boonei]|uniref:S-adenosylmethionine/tRNA-ribosyltransferase-isomerase n=1 Tax=Aciduliprofundum boonei (strain DSM 19572 / T469) TaxID=439481 RepID=B5ICM3_ACIB4|nr:tRNA preQ1(34) S-adenosylmethionine ribosyltransferase-isomerase QueA [Candidatus Aciduliprofundum boonei]ADD09102.1 S-adenosylmethionine/tRNA-ribosyltransferase-isomerase [Aciduliprofundum boonei T469]EDY35973.1 S-adenosylmethionine:tRNA ribosyltransferase-isomerase [Aciduliprofundum boonei T469]HII55354.1 tRNA preQ1(34) S-adenosylmethionine ribosyltransferase-isomerase QueA [Candidatus Aciduliprofundum boonei]
MYSLRNYDFELPEELIAQEPVEPRDHARLMVLRKGIEHRYFYNLPEYMDKGDVLILNDTKVIKARIRGIKDTGGKVEILILEKLGENYYRCLVKGKKIHPGSVLIFEDIKGVVREKNEGICDIEFSGDIMDLARRRGEVPLPPYIKNPPTDAEEKYQTVFARREGAVAAPTAGLHFTPQLLKEIEKKGVKIGYITLHVSYGTFKPVKTEDIREHRVDEEYYIVGEEVAKLINEREGRLFAVGTTVTRALESSSKNGIIYPSRGYTIIFIYPGYKFQSGIDALITNFHVPRSSLILLVTAFGGYERIMKAYRIAIEKKYRFYSFGDAMLIFKM